MNKVTFAVIGFGHIGKKHAIMVHGTPNSDLLAIVDTDEEKRRVASETYPDIKVFDSIESMFSNDILPDVVNICTPNGYHASQAIEVLEQKSHVVIEKPMGLTRQECEEVIFKSLQVSRHVFCVKPKQVQSILKMVKASG